MKNTTTKTSLKAGNYAVAYNRAADTLSIQMSDPNSTIVAGFSRIEAIDLVAQIYKAIGCSAAEFNAQFKKLK